MGSMSDEPVFWANLCASGGHQDVGVLVEQSLVGESYIRNFRRACPSLGIRIVAEERIPQTAQDVHTAVRALQDNSRATVPAPLVFVCVLAAPPFGGRHPRSEAR